MLKILKKLIDCFFLLRIPLLAPVWTIFILGWITGSEQLLPGGFFTSVMMNKVQFFQMWIILSGFSLIVASTYVLNQIVDIESDRINHKLFLLPHGIISIPTAWVLACTCAVSGLLIAMLYNMVFMLLFISGLLLGVAYNLPPITLKNRAWGGVCANTAGHGFIAFIVGWYCAKYPLDIGTEIIMKGILSSLSPSFANAAVFLVTTIPDADGDIRTGKKTFYVAFGEKITARFAAVMCLGATITAFLMENHFWVMFIPSLISLLFFFNFAVTMKKEIAFKAFKWPVFLLSIAVSLFVPEYAALIVITFFVSKLYYKRRFNIDYPTFKSK